MLLKDEKLQVRWCLTILRIGTNKQCEGDLSCIIQEATDSQNEELCRAVMKEETTQAVRVMPSDKALGPDGIPVEFTRIFGPLRK